MGTPHKKRNQQFYPRVRNLTNIKFTKEEIEILNYRLQHSIEKLLPSYLTTLTTETERVIKLLDTRMQNTHQYIATKKLQQLINSNRHHKPQQKRQLYIFKQINQKL
jgi:hypothetical protein